MHLAKHDLHCLTDTQFYMYINLWIHFTKGIIDITSAAYFVQYPIISDTQYLSHKAGQQ